MANVFDRNLNFKNVLNFDSLEKPVQQHLKNVYSSLSICMLAAAAGGYVHLFTNIMQAGLLSIFGSLGLLVMLAWTPHSRENETKRLMYLTGFAFLTGIGLGPLMEIVIMIDPSIIPTALLATSVVFICFTLSALFSGNSRQFLFLGGILFSGLFLMLFLGLLNIFIGSKLLYNVNLYLGLVIMCGFVLYDTQLIVEKRRHGDDDYIWHCVDLFIDFIQIFRRLMIILANKENNKRNRRE